MTANLLNVTLDRLDDQTRVRLGGEVDVSTAHLVGDALDRVFAENATRAVVLDLTSVTFLASAGLALLVRAHLRTEETDVAFSVVVASGSAPARAIAVTGLDLTLRVVAESDRRTGTSG